MSEERSKNLSGALFKNDKEGNEKRPDYKGTYTDGEGREFYVSAWVKDSAKGTKYMSLSMQPKEKKEPAHTPKKEYAKTDSSELPF